jgi:hypothetical protein
VEEEVMRKAFEPETRVPGATRRIDPDTLMPMSDDKGRPLWNMPAPVSYAEHTRWRRHKRTGERIGEPIQVPVYRGTSASYARWVKGQIRRNQRKAAEAQAAVDALNEAEKNPLQEAEAAMTDLVLNPGGHNVEAEDFTA